MDLIADGLLIATAMTAGLYCLVLSKRLRRLTDSGSAIGPQIEALDQALGDTRAALAETREGVSELRSSTKAVIAELTRETARGEDIAELIERGVGEAKATMQRLYEAADRIEAYENRPAKANHAGEGDPDGPPPDGPSDAGAGEAAPVTEVQPGSPADEAGLRRGDVIIEVNRIEIADLGELREQLKSGDKTVLMLIRRDDSTLYLPMKRAG